MRFPGVEGDGADGTRPGYVGPATWWELPEHRAAGVGGGQEPRPRRAAIGIQQAERPAGRGGAQSRRRQSQLRSPWGGE